MLFVIKFVFIHPTGWPDPEIEWWRGEEKKPTVKRKLNPAELEKNKWFHSHHPNIDNHHHWWQLTTTTASSIHWWSAEQPSDEATTVWLGELTIDSLSRRDAAANFTCRWIIDLTIGKRSE